MDQSKTRLPRFYDIRKSFQILKQTLHHHVTGVLNHGFGKSYVFTWTDKFPCDANVTINCLLNVFDDVAKNNGGSLPEVLYLQADNAAKDNKNKLDKLILPSEKWNFHLSKQTSKNKKLSSLIYPLVKLSFLMRWHFSSREKLSGHQTPHLFAITESAGKVILHYKDWPLRSVNYQDLDITNLAKSVISRPPVVNVIDFRLLAELDAMALSLCKWKNQGRLLGPSIEWWSGYIQYLRTTGHLPETPCLEKFRKYNQYSVVASPLPPELSHIIENHAMKTKKTSKVKLVKSGNSVE
ncbi:hypothetical protein KUTeg_017592 [Tegillarca granosa]|uniref:DUF7869 domain-containing protein n=1 Tax=Tegillarca granosa TaxID=220873 RepID=A0ABQ9EFC8_TEGGR|nr:hypothetical protein KUTeg_017592 [Tegillarca granosa]